MAKLVVVTLVVSVLVLVKGLALVTLPEVPDLAVGRVVRAGLDKAV